MRVVFYLEGYESVAGKGIVAKIDGEVIPQKGQVWDFYNDVYGQKQVVLLVEQVIIKFVNNEFDHVLVNCSRIK